MEKAKPAVSFLKHLADAQAGIRVMAFGRISRNDEKVENQLGILEQQLNGSQIDKLDWTLVWKAQEVHTAFGEDGILEKRLFFNEMLKMADEHRFDILYVYHSDRLTRQGGFELLGLIFRLRNAGVRVVSFREGEIIINRKPAILTEAMQAIWWFISGQFSLIESMRNSERVKNRNDRELYEAKLEGRTARLGGGAGRHTLSKEQLELIFKLHEQGGGYGMIAQETGLSVWDIRKAVEKGKKVSDSLKGF